jgi:8-oxo-dGTP pyrophosphatase MutT (NUDIX family)
MERVRAAFARLDSTPAGSDPHGRARAAVLVPLFELHGDVRVILTRRAAHLRSHTGEVSFPGGRLDAGETPLDAALREAAEEVGMAVSATQIIGQLAPIATISASSSITPFVAVLDDRPTLRPNPGEVERAFDVALAELLADGVFREEWWQLADGGERPMYFFDLADDIVWGATARMLYELLELVAFASGGEDSDGEGRQHQPGQHGGDPYGA